MCTAGIWHNDIKPEDILLVSCHPDSDLKVADFGFARTLQYCQSGEVICGYGTKGYMAPEVEQHEWHSHQAEMYSIGAVLYFMLCGEDHFDFDDGKKPLQIYYQSLLLLHVLDMRAAYALYQLVSHVKSCSLFQDVSACCALYCLLHQP